MLLKRTDRQRIVHRLGVLLFDGAYEDIIDLDVFTEWDANKDPARMQLGVRTAKRAVRITGEVLTMAPLALFPAEGLVPDKDYKIVFSGKHDPVSYTHLTLPTNREV